MPESLTFEQAASCGVPYTTAWDGLVRAKVCKGTRFVVIGANGAVGRAAVALARSVEARVLAAVRRPEQAEMLEKEGYETLLLSTPVALVETVTSRFGALADAIYDTTGKWLPASVAAMADHGHLVVIAPPGAGENSVEFPVLDFYRRGGTLVGVNSLLHDTFASAAMLSEFAKRFDAGALQPPAPAKVMPLTQGAEAYRLVD